MTESFNYCCNYRIVNVVGIMPRKQTPFRKSKLVVCSMCAKTILKKDISIVKTFDGFAYSFDSDDCLLIFRKLRDVYGKNFFRPAASE